MMTASSSVANLFSVAGKNVLVTGGSRGIGEMIAKGFSAAGAHVLLTSRDEKACRETAAAISQSTHNPCHYVASNVSTREGCELLAKHVAEVFDNKLVSKHQRSVSGSLAVSLSDTHTHTHTHTNLPHTYAQHVLVNNAGTSWGEPLERESKTNWGFDKVLELNVKGMFYLTRYCLPLLRETASPQDPARIINVGSVAGLMPQEAPTHAYDISKAAVHQLTRKFASDFCRDHITVNCLAPGFVPSRMSAGLETWGGSAEKLAAHIPLGRMGCEDDMVGACLYFSSRAGSWCTGVILNVDGGTVGAHSIPLSSL